MRVVAVRHAVGDVSSENVVCPTRVLVILLPETTTFELRITWSLPVLSPIRRLICVVKVVVLATPSGLTANSPPLTSCTVMNSSSTVSLSTMKVGCVAAWLLLSSKR